MADWILFIPPENSPLYAYYGYVGEVIHETESRVMFRIRLEGHHSRSPSTAQISAVREHVEVIE